MKTIRMTLNPVSIDNAIQELRAYQKELKEKSRKLALHLAERGAEIAKTHVASMGAMYTGELAQSIEGYYSESAGCGIVKAGAWYAMYVEFGTGVVGQQNPHPAPGGWVYDVNQHGEAGWWYFNERDGRYHWTKGFESRPFMYLTAQDLERECARIAREVFGRAGY